MKDVSFGSTFRIPISQAGVNSAKKTKLKTFILSYENGLIGNSKSGYARISIPNKEDEKFIRLLKALGYKVFQKFEGENIPKDNLDIFIKEKLDSRNYNQIGKPMKKMSHEMKQQRRFEKNYVEPFKIEDTVENENQHNPFYKVEDRKDEIRQNNKSYQELKEKYGEEFAEAVFFEERHNV